jgi:hypothetical protein
MIQRIADHYIERELRLSVRDLKQSLRLRFRYARFQHNRLVGDGVALVWREQPGRHLYTCCITVWIYS